MSTTTLDFLSTDHVPRFAHLITDDLRKWIVDQAKAGVTPEAALQGMLAVGWVEEQAVDILETVMREYLTGQSKKPKVIISENTLKAAANPLKEDHDRFAMPESLPKLRRDNKELHLAAAPAAEGEDLFPAVRPYVIAHMESPQVVVLGNFLSDQECDAIIAMATPRMQRSTVTSFATGESYVDPIRSSQGMFFQRLENELISRIDRRIAHYFQWPVEFGEGLQILKYVPGAEYKAHQDYFDPHSSGYDAVVTKRGGQRIGTVVMYLNDPEAGGATGFPDVGLEVSPKRGNAVFFCYPTPEARWKCLHAGTPVVAGEKWIATKWMRNNVFT